MDRNSTTRADYKVDNWVDIEHCVYHALIDAPEQLATHRIAHVVGRIAATLVEKKIVTPHELESFLHSCRG